MRAAIGTMALLFVVAGCAPGSVRSGGYAGMDRGEALREVAAYEHDEVVARSGPLTHHRLLLDRLYHGKTSRGDDAWVGRYHDRTERGLICIRVRKTDETIVSEDFDAEIDDCSLDSDPPPPPPS